MIFTVIFRIWSKQMQKILLAVSQPPFSIYKMQFLICDYVLLKSLFTHYNSSHYNSNIQGDRGKTVQVTLLNSVNSAFCLWAEIANYINCWINKMTNIWMSNKNLHWHISCSFTKINKPTNTLKDFWRNHQLSGLAPLIHNKNLFSKKA